MFLVATGNVNPYEIIKIVEQNLAKKEFTPFVEPKILGVKEDKSVVKKQQTVKLNITTPEYRYALKIPRRNFKNITDAELAIYLGIFNQINFGPSSDFRENLRSKELVSSFNSRINFIEDYVIIAFYAVTDYPQELEKELDEQLKNYLLTKEDFERKRKMEIASLILKYDDIIAVNESIQNSLIMTKAIIADIKEIYENLTLSRMEEIAKIITLDNKATMIGEPNKN